MQIFSELVPVAAEDPKHFSGLLWHPGASSWREKMSKDFGNHFWSLVSRCSLLSQVITPPQAGWRWAGTESKPRDEPGSSDAAEDLPQARAQTSSELAPLQC